MNLVSRANATIAFLVLVLLFGGASAAGFAGNTALQVAAAGLIAWTLWDEPWQQGVKTGLGRFAVALAVVACIQFIPLPPLLWAHLPGRDAVARGFDLLGSERPWLMVSLAPWESLSSLTWWIPALAMFVAMRSRGAPPARQLIAAITAVALVSVLIGVVQRYSGSAYFYQITNYGEGPGFFSNSNHQGSFLLAALGLWSSHLFSDSRSTKQDGRIFTWAAWAAWAVLVGGVLVSGSLACVALLVPLLGGIMLIARPGWKVRWPLVLGLAALMIAGFAALLMTGLAANDLLAKNGTPGISRQEFLMTGLKILRDFAPLGTGIGTFPDIYPWYENANLVGGTYVNHAHDDLLELLIETGVPGFIALAVFLSWYARRAIGLWGASRTNPVALGASLVVGVILIHSLADYPLRTAAMSSIFVLACVLMVRPVDAADHRGHRRMAATDRHQADHTMRI